MTSRAEPRLPESIQSDWAPFLNSLHASWQQWGWRLVRTYLPPLSVEALAFVDALYTADWDRDRPDQTPWSDLLNPDEVSLTQSAPRRIRTSHPLFAAIYQFFPDHDLGHARARHLLLAYLAEPEAPEDALEPQAYYDDALALRRCLEALDSSNRLSQLPTFPALPDLVQALDALPEEALAEKGLEDKIQTIRSLTERKRFVGTRQFHQHNRTRTTRLPRRELTRATPGSRPKNKRRSGGGSDRAGTDSSEPVIGGRRYQRKAAPGGKAKNEEPGDPDTPQRMERTEPSALTPADDWLALRRTGGMPPTVPVTALTDPARLPTTLLVQAFNVLSKADAEAWALAWLVVTTGMNPQRLKALEEATSTTIPDWAPQWHRGEQLLSFRLRDGPAHAEEDTAGANRVVALPLPHGLQRALAAGSSPQPLAEEGPHANKILRQAFQQAPGPTPRLSRLRASAWAWIRPRAWDPVAAALLSGQFGAGLSSQAAYRALNADEIATLFRSTNKDLANHLANAPEAEAALKDRMAGISFPDTTPSGTVGSSRTYPLGAFELTLSLLQEAFTQVGDQARAARGNPDLEAVALQQLVNIQALYGYLGWLLATAARPIGPKTAFQPLGWAWFLADKASARYQEVRVLPPVAPVQTHLEQATEDRNRVLRHLDRRGWSAKDQRKESQRALPALLSNNKGQVFRVQALHQPDFETWMGRLELDAFMPTPANAARHTMATQLRGRLPASLVDAYLGHHGHGADRLGPASSVAITAWQPLTDQITEVLDRVGFVPLKVGQVWS